MICTRCKKRMAVVFMSKNDGDSTVSEGYCFTCARDLGIKPVNDLISQMGISEEEIDAMSEQIVEMGPDGVDDLVKGGSATFPFMNMFSSSNETDDPSIKTKSKPKENIDKKRKYLSAYCENLTKKAYDGFLDNIVGRNNEIYRVIQILSRRTKNNPCLIGEPGVGKTAIAEGIAQRIVANDVPSKLADKEIYLLDLTALVAGTQFRGQFEGRIKGLVEEVKREGNIILFIDEVHNLVGAGDSEGSMNAANILKPALSRGEIQVIGATTFKEYRKYIEKDSALERRFQPVRVNEPTVKETIDVIMGIKHYYEAYHNVKIPNDIVVATVNMSEKYITDRFLPDKAIDLMDEACSCTALENKDLSNYEKLMKKLTGFEKVKIDLEVKTDVNYEQLAKTNAEIISLKEQIKVLEPIVANIKVTYDNLTKVIEIWTGIPASKIKESEIQKVSNLYDEISKKIVGQDDPVKQIVNAIKRSRVQLTNIKRPASFVFVGPTGVGKTELVKVIANHLFDGVDPLIRLDMSEYMEKHSASKIIGSPPGYLGYDDAGQLTEKVRRQPYSIILFDEIEKAHPDVMNILLQVLDEGKITDSHGRVINFSNTIIVMTSNAGSNLKVDSVGFNKTKSNVSKENAMKGLKEFLRPEFLSRVDEVIVFNSLEQSDYSKITDILLGELKESIKNRGIAFNYTGDVKDFISKIAIKNKSGARDIRKEIRRQVEDRVANILIDNFENEPTIIDISVKDNVLDINFM
ncbi:MAG: ATP-dependent Clp protease ATP-binding subunit [Oscillospiraceae bacterium]